MNRGPTNSGMVEGLDERDEATEVKVIVDAHQEVPGIDELPQCTARAGIERTIPTRAIDRLEHEAPFHNQRRTNREVLPDQPTLFQQVGESGSPPGVMLLAKLV